MLSGSYLGSILPTHLAQHTLKFTYGGSMYGITTGQVFGANTTLSFPTQVNEKSYAVPAPDCLLPTGGAYSTFVYTPGNYGAGIAYQGTDCLYVPATSLDLISKYIGQGEDSPVKLNKLGGDGWAKSKARAKKAR